MTKDSPKKKPIPKALREQVWIQNVGSKFENKCLITWCQNTMNVFDFHVGHNIPESKGGKTDINNLKPICARCNLSMGNHHSITEWNQLGMHKNKVPKRSWWCCKRSWWCC